MDKEKEDTTVISPMSTGSGKQMLVKDDDSSNDNDNNNNTNTNNNNDDNDDDNDDNNMNENENENEREKDDIVIVSKNESDECGDAQIEDKPLTIDMTPKAQASTKSDNVNKDVLIAGTPKNGIIGNNEQNEKQSLLDMEIEEGKPTTVRGEKAQKKKKIDSKHSHKNDKNNKNDNNNNNIEKNEDHENNVLLNDSRVTPGGEMEDGNELIEDENNGQVIVVEDSLSEKCGHCCFNLKESGALLSIIITLVVWSFLIWMAVEHNTASIACFIVAYCIYIGECFVSKTYREIKIAQVSDTNSVKVLRALKDCAPTIHWHVECYRIETIYSVPDETKKVILWLYGKEKDTYVLKKAGYRVECFQSEWTIINYMSDPMNFPKIAAVILPMGQVVGFSQLQKSITKKLKEARLNSLNIVTNAPTTNDGCNVNNAINTNNKSNDNSVAKNSTSKAARDSVTTADEIVSINDTRRKASSVVSNNSSTNDGCPVFLKWHESNHDRISLLLKDCVNHDILKKTRKETISHTSDETYKFKDWKDVSDEIPKFENSITNLTIEKSYVFKDRNTRLDYDNQLASFRNSDENNCDEQQRFKEKLKIRGWKANLLIKPGNDNNDNDRLPWWMTQTGFWVTSVLMFTIIPRLKVFGVKDVTWRLIKQVSA